MNKSKNFKLYPVGNGIALAGILLSLALPKLVVADNVASGALGIAGLSVPPFNISRPALADGIQAVQQSRGSRANSV